MKHKVIIVGAGMAGIAAGRKLYDAGQHDFIILEGGNDIGGRLRSTMDPSGQTYELGAAFLHSASENPFAQWLLAQGHRLTELHPAEHIIVNHHQLDEHETDAFGRHYDKIRIHADRLAHRDENATAAQLLSGDPLHDTALRAFAGPTETGAELSELSISDVAGQIELHKNAIFSGSLIEALRPMTKDLPINLLSLVTAVDSSGDQIHIKTNAGDYHCDKLILTCSTDILCDHITFTPSLPDKKRSALEHLRQGTLNKIFLKFKEPLWAVNECFYALIVDEIYGQCECWVFPHQPNVLCVFLGGNQKDVTAEEFHQHFAPQLTSALPHLVENPLIWSKRTDWQNEPLVRGSYSALRPGAANAREIYSQPIDGRIFLAGEAADGQWATQLSGAMLSGQAAARRVLQKR